MRIIRLGNSAPCHYEKGELGEEPVLKTEQPVFETATEIAVSPDSSLQQAIAEIKTIWSIHSHNDAPDWISGNNEALVSLLAEEMKISEVRAFQ